MSYAILPALRVKDAAEKALLEIAAAGTAGDAKPSRFEGLIGLCRAVLADPKADHDIAIDPADFILILKHYDFTDPRLLHP